MFNNLFGNNLTFDKRNSISAIVFIIILSYIIFSLKTSDTFFNFLHSTKIIKSSNNPGSNKLRTDDKNEIWKRKKNIKKLNIIDNVAKAEPVENFNKELVDNIYNLKATLFNNPILRAISAPNIGIKKRISVINIDGKIVVFINAKIIKKSGIQYIIENSLSLPKIRKKVKRPLNIDIEYYDVNKNLIKINLKRKNAALFAREMDYLDGIVLKK